jgi:hypothetical protein
VRALQNRAEPPAAVEDAALATVFAIYESAATRRTERCSTTESS